MQQDPTGESISERKHQFVQSQIQQAAFDLFLTQGYDGTTVDEIAQAAGISRRTFFRYFESKEDVSITALSRTGEFIEHLLRTRPLEESPTTATKQAIRQYVAHYQQSEPKAWQVMNLIQSTPRMRARFLLLRDGWMERLAAILVDRGVPPSRAEVVAAAGLAMLTVVYHRWIADQNIDVAVAVEEAFEELNAICEE